MSVTPGLRVTLLKPRFFVAPVGTQLVPQALAYGGDVNAEITDPVLKWIRVPYTVSGMNVVYNNPKQDVTADEVGVLDTLPSGGDSITFNVQPRTPRIELLKWINGWNKATVAVRAAAVGPPAIAEAPAYESYWLDVDVDNNFMVMFEGKARAGGLYGEERLVRFYGYRCEQTANPTLSAGSTGVDRLMNPTIEARCLPVEIPDSQIDADNTGIVRAALDPDGRSNWFFIDQTA